MDDRIERNGEGVEDEEKESPRRLMSQFFIFPLIIVVVGIGVFVLFGLVSSESKSAADYVNELKRSGSWLHPNSRLQAAYELSKVLANTKEKSDLEAIAIDLIDVFNKARRGDDPRLRQYLAIALGHLGDQRAVPPLIDALADEDGKTRFYAIYALGELHAKEAVPDLVKISSSEDHDFRKMSIYVLGLINDERAVPVLKAALNDDKDDIKWNAALGLARFGDRSGTGVLFNMLDRDYLTKISGIRDDQKEQAIVNAIRALVMLKEKSVESKLKSLSKGDPSLKVRQTALEALEQFKKIQDLTSSRLIIQ